MGIEVYAVWSLLSVIISFAELGNFGMGNALITFVSEEKEVENTLNVEVILSNATYIILVPLLILFPVLFFFNSEIVSLLKVPSAYQGISETIVPYIYLIVVFYLINDNFKSVVVGIGRLDISNLFFVLSNFVKLLIAILFLFLGYGLFSMLISYIISSAFLSIAYLIILRKNGIRFRINNFNLKVQKKILSFGIKMLGISVMNMLMMPISKIVLANMDIKAVAYFEIGSKVVYAVFGIIQKGIYAFLPQMARYRTALKENIVIIHNTCKKVANLSTLFSLLLFLVLDLTAPFWMRLWLQNAFSLEILYAYYIIQIGIFFAIYSLPFYYSLLGIGKENVCLMEAVIRCLTNLCLLFVLLHLWKSSFFVYVSFAISTVISNLFVLFKGQAFYRRISLSCY